MMREIIKTALMGMGIIFGIVVFVTIPVYLAVQFLKIIGIDIQ